MVRKRISLFSKHLFFLWRLCRIIGFLTKDDYLLASATQRSNLHITVSKDSGIQNSPFDPNSEGDGNCSDAGMVLPPGHSFDSRSYPNLHSRLNRSSFRHPCVEIFVFSKKMT